LNLINKVKLNNAKTFQSTFGFQFFQCFDYLLYWENSLSSFQFSKQKDNPDLQLKGE